MDRKMYFILSNENRAATAILISDKIEFKLKMSKEMRKDTTYTYMYII